MYVDVIDISELLVLFKYFIFMLEPLHVYWGVWVHSVQLCIFAFLVQVLNQQLDLQHNS